MTRIIGNRLLAICAALTLSACDKIDTPKIDAPLPSLKEQAGYFRLAPDAPTSRFLPAGDNSSAAGGNSDSSVGTAAASTSEFRLAEVAPGRLEQTRILLSQLDAKQDANQAIRFSLPADILFDFDKANLRPDAERPLSKAQQLIAAYPKAPITIIGYTDAKGDEDYNDRLSLSRANSVSARLMASGGRHATVKGEGERDPVAPNARPDGSDDPDGRQRNRRVEIILAPVISEPKG